MWKKDIESHGRVRSIIDNFQEYSFHLLKAVMKVNRKVRVRTSVRRRQSSQLVIVCSEVFSVSSSAAKHNSFV